MALPGSSPLRMLVAAAALWAIAGCGGGSEPDASSPATPGNTLPTEKGGPLLDLPQCDAPPAAIEADVAGLVLPDGAVITTVEEVGELVSVRAYVGQTPIQVRQFYAKEPGLELYEIEDEVYEAEVLFGGGDYRSFVKAQAQCQQGSLLSVYVGPRDSGGLPTVSGG